MKEHIEIVLREVESEIARLQTLHAALKAFAGGSSLAELSAPEAGAPEPSAAPKKARRKYTRRQPAEPTADRREAAAGVPPASTAAGRPETITAAMKDFVFHATKPFSIEQIKQVLKTEFPDLVALMKDPHTPDANIHYWTAKEHLEKIGTGSQATFRVLNREWFRRTE